MTWQRIDEDTYIDGTLITCAEYQLFIDEMREQEKYYQPDHWASYRFPKGLGKEPVLGVRFNDSRDFCAWLTSRNETWLYRMPSISESELGLHDTTWGFGYWVDERTFVTKATTKPYPNYRHLSESNIALLENAFKVIEKDVDLASFISVIGSKLSETFSRHDRQNPLVMAQVCSCLPLDIERYFITEKLLTGIFNLRLILKNLRKDIQRYKKVFNITLEEGINLVLSYTASDDNYLVMSYTADYEKAIRTSPKLIQLAANLGQSDIEKLKRAVILSMVREFLIYFYVDMFTLSERIAGRSPAFEGIRLVKERIR